MPVSLSSKKAGTNLRWRGRADIKFTLKYGLRNAFKKGNNSSMLRYHCHLHFEIYRENCTKAGVEMHPRAVPDHILKQVGKKTKGIQGTLDGQLLKMRPREFTKAEILCCVAQFVVCDDQVGF